MDFTIRRVEPRDERRWRELWDGYWRFYGREPREEVTQQTWSRIHDPSSPIFAIVAEAEDGEIVAIANCVVHEHTSTLAPICYLADLFVDPARRAGGAGKRLMDWLVAEMKAQGWARLYWTTKEDNYRARGLYDKYVPHSGFVRYAVENT